MTAAENIPTRLHHTAYVSRNLEETRRFYEDLIGLPLIATWCEKDVLFGSERVYCHVFFGLADGSALAFFQFAEPGDQDLFGPSLTSSPFRHIAVKCDEGTQDGILKRLQVSQYSSDRYYVLEHGYCRSLYATDPDGMIMEFTVDDPHAADGDEKRRLVAHDELRRWLAGDRRPNNDFRPHS